MKVLTVLLIASLASTTACHNNSKGKTFAAAPEERITAFHYMVAENSTCLASTISNASVPMEAGPCPETNTLNSEVVEVLRYCPAYQAGDTQRAQLVVYKKYLLDGALRETTEEEADVLCQDPNS